MRNYLFCLMLFVGTQYFSAQNFKDYCNARFDFCVPVPENFKGLGESQNGDGQIFKSNDGVAEIRAFGSLEDDEVNNLQWNYNQYLTSKTITYKVRKANYFILSGTEQNGNIFYLKVVKKRINYFGYANTNVIQTLIITYPKSQNSKYSSYCKIISKRL